MFAELFAFFLMLWIAERPDPCGEHPCIITPP